MSAAVWLHDGPVGSGPGAVRLPSETVRKCERCTEVEHPPTEYGESYCPHCGYERRVVSPVVDLPEGRLWHAVEQRRENIAGDWNAWHVRNPICALLGGSASERRLVVVGYSDTQTLPVVADSERRAIPDQTHVVLGDGFVTLWRREGPRNWRTSDATDEPWAADLVPGDRVLRWESVVMLDQPITTERCDESCSIGDDNSVSCGCGYGVGGLELDHLAAVNAALFHDRPLQLAPGWNPSVELETP